MTAGALQRTKVLLPLQRPDLFRGSLLRLDKGILLYGPPGTGANKNLHRSGNACGSSWVKPPLSACVKGQMRKACCHIAGKTMLAKALAKESGAAFINISASSMQSKW